MLPINVLAYVMPSFLSYWMFIMTMPQSRALWLLGGALPLGVQTVVNGLLVRSWWDLHHGALGRASFAFSCALMSFDIYPRFSVVVDYHHQHHYANHQGHRWSPSSWWVHRARMDDPSRPVLIPIDVIARCQPLADSEDPLWGLSTIDICTQTSERLLEDGWRSFPSGHSSRTSVSTLESGGTTDLGPSHKVSFAGLGFLTFYLAGKFHLFDTRGHAVSFQVLAR